MPYLISRQQAIDEINESLSPGACLVCKILDEDSSMIVEKGLYTTTVLSKYPRTWGQTMIMLNTHKVSVSEMKAEEWSELSEKIHKYAAKIEQRLKPLRCYISSLGASENLPNTCPHIHFNLIPVYNKEDKPSDIFTWEKGVYAASEEEWSQLLKKLQENNEM